MIGAGVGRASGGGEDVCRGSKQDPERRPADEGQTGNHRLQDRQLETVRTSDPGPEPDRTSLATRHDINPVNVCFSENESLWREVASLRQKHAQQQKVVNKVINTQVSIAEASMDQYSAVSGASKPN